MDFLVELFLDVIVEGFMQMITWGWIRLLQLVLPWAQLSEKTKNRLKLGVDIIGLCLFVAFVAGVIMLFQYGALTKTVGRYVTIISLGISLIPILLVGILKLVRCFIRSKASK